MGLATKVQRTPNGGWIGLDGPLRADDHAALNEILRREYDQELAETSAELCRHIADAKEHMKAIRDLTEARDSLG